MKGPDDPMTTEDVDIHRTRQVLLERIRTLPGVSFSSLQRSFALNKGTLEYHLHYLERKNDIISKKTGRSRTYYSSAHDPFGTIGWDGILPEQKRVLNIIRNEPGIDLSQLLQRTNISKPKLYRVISTLKEHRTIMEVENGKGTGYEFITNDDLLEEMLLELADRFMKGELDRETFLRMKDLLDRKKKGAV